MIRVKVKDNVGKYEPMDFFKLLNDGIKKRLPKLAAWKFKALLLENIDKNTFNFKLSDRWLGYKSLRGWDSRPFIAERYYVDAIEVFAYKGHLTIGFKKRNRHPRSDMDMSDIAHILEFGRPDLNIPARPLWRYTTEEFFRKFPIYIRAVMP